MSGDLGRLLHTIAEQEEQRKELAMWRWCNNCSLHFWNASCACPLHRSRTTCAKRFELVLKDRCWSFTLDSKNRRPKLHYKTSTCLWAKCDEVFPVMMWFHFLTRFWLEKLGGVWLYSSGRTNEERGGPGGGFVQRLHCDSRCCKLGSENSDIELGCTWLTSSSGQEGCSKSGGGTGLQKEPDKYIETLFGV